MSNSGGPLPPYTVTMRAACFDFGASEISEHRALLCRALNRPARSLSRALLPPRFVEAEFAPARFDCVDIFRRRPDQRRKPRAVEFGIGIVIEIHGGIDQHAIPFAGAEQRGVASALARRWSEPQPECGGHDDDGVLAGID